MKLSVSNGIKLLLKRVYQKFTNGSRTKKSTPKGVSPLSVLLLFTLIVKYKKHNYFWMGGVSIISGTPRSVSGTISDLNNNYANQQYILLSKNIHTIYFNNSTAPLNTVIIITFIKVIRSYLVYIIIQPVRIEVVGVASP